MGVFKDIINENYPGGVYVAMKPTPDTLSKIESYIEANLKDLEINDEIHCTLIYSKKALKSEVRTLNYLSEATFQSFDLFGPDKNILVIKLESRDLIRRNNSLTSRYNFISDFDEYQPHVTLAYNCEDIDIEKLPPLDFTLFFADEYVEPLDLNKK